LAKYFERYPVAFVTFKSKLDEIYTSANSVENPHPDDVCSSKVSISLVCVSISILGEINQAILDSTLAPVVNSAYPFPEYTVPFRNIVPL
jgi:hypothetical protein